MTELESARRLCLLLRAGIRRFVPWRGSQPWLRLLDLPFFYEKEP